MRTHTHTHTHTLTHTHTHTHRCQETRVYGLQNVTHTNLNGQHTAIEAEDTNENKAGLYIGKTNNILSADYL